ncbi:MAG: monovalent cation/H+ antiporter complex subunit F [Defluviitaleaceae bacterium]|nr:monovalent cation/H+ antiporter complex subunit F [Defluviitaleaceae bacterium]
MLQIILYIFIAFLAIYAIRVLQGPTIWDRLLAMNLMSSKLIAFILIFAAYYQLSFLLDLAILYMLGGFMGTIFICMFFLDRTRGGGKRGSSNTNK